MHDESPPLFLANRFLRFLVGLNLFAGSLLLLLLGLLTIAQGPIMRALGFDDAQLHEHAAVGAKTMIVLALVAIGIMHFVMTEILAIVATVRAGDPFVAENAVRIERIAWAIVVYQVANVFHVAVARFLIPMEHNWDFPLASIMCAILLFVLARVFEHGTRMRDDLEGTV